MVYNWDNHIVQHWQNYMYIYHHIPKTAGNMYNNIINVENISFEFFISFFPLLYSDAEFI